MLLIYDLATGQVLDNSGKSSVWPEGPPDDCCYANIDTQGIPRESVGLLRLHDIDDAALVDNCMTHEHSVDVATTQVVIGAAHVIAAPPDRAAIINAATDLDGLKSAIIEVLGL